MNINIYRLKAVSLQVYRRGLSPGPREDGEIHAVYNVLMLGGPGVGKSALW